MIILMYYIYLDDLLDQSVKCLAFFVDEKQMWHKKLGHAYMRLSSAISQKVIFKCLPKISFENDSTYEFDSSAELDQITN